MTIWNWLLVVSGVLLWTACVLMTAQLMGEWKRRERYAEDDRCRRKWGVDTW